MAAVTPKDKSIEPFLPADRWWLTSVLSAAFGAGLFALVGPRGPHLAIHTGIAFGVVFGLVMFCHPAHFFRRLSWVCLMFLGCVVASYGSYAQGRLAAHPLVLFIVHNAVWLGGIFALAAVFFAVLEYLHYRSLGIDDAFGDEVELTPRERKAGVSRGNVRTLDPSMTAVRPAEPYVRKRHIADQECLTQIVARYRERELAGPAVSVLPIRPGPAEAERLLASLDSALTRIDTWAARGNAEAITAAKEARTSADLTGLQRLLVAEAERRAQVSEVISDSDTVQLCREIAAVADLRGEAAVSEEYLTALIGFDATDVESLLRLGKIQLIGGRLEEALQTFRRILVSTSVSEWLTAACTNGGLTLQLQGDLGEAERMFERALLIDEQVGDGKGMAADYGYLGRIYRARGSFGKAERMFAMALEIDDSLVLSQTNTRAVASRSERVKDHPVAAADHLTQEAEVLEHALSGRH